jgi:nucleotide-binding universal stress UspA family protein
MYKRILIPVDGSQTSSKALTAALQLARDANGQVRLVHMVDDLAYIGGYEAYGAYSAQLMEIAQKVGNQILDGALAVARAAGVQADQMLFDKFGAQLGETVADASKRWNADLIVVGTHGRRGIGRMFLGSGAEQIIRLAPVHVLVVRSLDDEGHHAPS